MLINWNLTKDYPIISQESLVVNNFYLNKMAKEAYRSYILAYNSHSMKDIFNVHRLDFQVRLSLHVTFCIFVLSFISFRTTWIWTPTEYISLSFFFYWQDTSLFLSFPFILRIGGKWAYWNRWLVINYWNINS